MHIHVLTAQRFCAYCTALHSNILFSTLSSSDQQDVGNAHGAMDGESGPTSCRSHSDEVISVHNRIIVNILIKD
jgi:hypothetical protein